MTSMTVMSLIYQAMLVALKLASPMLLSVLIVGLTISIFQAATQISEMTLAFVPKLLAGAAALALAGPWLITTMVDYIQGQIGMIPQMVQ